MPRLLLKNITPQPALERCLWSLHTLGLAKVAPAVPDAKRTWSRADPRLEEEEAPKGLGG